MNTYVKVTLAFTIFQARTHTKNTSFTQLLQNGCLHFINKSNESPFNIPHIFPVISLKKRTGICAVKSRPSCIFP